MTLRHVGQAVIDQDPVNAVVVEIFGGYAQSEFFTHLGAEELTMNVLHDDIAEFGSLLAANDPPVQANRAAGPLEADEHARESRFSRSVGTDECGHPTAWQLESRNVEDPVGTIGEAQVLQHQAACAPGRCVVLSILRADVSRMRCGPLVVLLGTFILGVQDEGRLHGGDRAKGAQSQVGSLPLAHRPQVRGGHLAHDPAAIEQNHTIHDVAQIGQSVLGDDHGGA